VALGNNLDRIETIRADGRIDGADPSIAALTGKIDVRFADTMLMRVSPSGGIIGWAMSAALALAAALGIDPAPVAALLPAIEAVMMKKINEQMNQDHGAGFSS